MARYCNVLPFYGDPQTAFNQIYQILTASGFTYVQYQNENVFQKGIGALTAPTFVKVSFYAQTVQVEAWLKYAIYRVFLSGDWHDRIYRLRCERCNEKCCSSN